MNNLLILYNPYYQNDVIEQHLAILKVEGQVAFGKVKSKLKDMSNVAQDDLERIYRETSEANFLQLFLCDYANLFVAKVVQITQDTPKFLPKYYNEKNLEVESYFIIQDLKELVRGDFSTIRDEFLSKFKTPHYGNHTYAIYGNSYVYPLPITQDTDYFLDSTKQFLNIYKSAEYLQIQGILVDYVFGKKVFYKLHSLSVENLIFAELEFAQNASNPLYDFTSVIVKYAKSLESELYSFAKTLFLSLSRENPEILDITYSVQQHSYTISDFFTHKPNIGTISFLLSNDKIVEIIGENGIYAIRRDILKPLKILQDIRNECVHKRIPRFSEVETFRTIMLGIEKPSILKAIIAQKSRL